MSLLAWRLRSLVYLVEPIPFGEVLILPMNMTDGYNVPIAAY